ncbi:hypothetical protein OsI_11405 [Oryza sativa Indica Group]|uniref:DUF642 domain-containing protein n=1 Tax=Oryza sativa subsp. indica TaxID=39946 RepID=B8AP10_ORYSI|nr:hypothetical protein OsI_11405 [Oryza sativa Indica Group]
MLKNGGFEEGPYIFPNTSWGVLVPPMDEDDHTPLSPWTILSTTKGVKYIDAAHYAVPGGARAVELVSGMETAMVQEVSTVPGRSYKLEFSVGDAGDGCSGSLTVQAAASAEEKTDAGTTATAVRSVDGRTAIAAASGGVAAMGNPTAAAITQVLHNKQEFRLTAGVDDLLVVSIGSGSSSAAPSATPSSRGLLLGPVGEADAELAAAQEVAVEFQPRKVRKNHRRRREPKAAACSQVAAAAQGAPPAPIPVPGDATRASETNHLVPTPEPNRTVRSVPVSLSPSGARDSTTNPSSLIEPPPIRLPRRSDRSHRTQCRSGAERTAGRREPRRGRSRAAAPPATRPHEAEAARRGRTRPAALEPPQQEAVKPSPTNGRIRYRSPSAGRPTPGR